MAQFLRLATANGSGAKTGGLLVNLEWVRCIDEIRPGHCRLVFAPDHAIPIDGPAADTLLDSLAGPGGRQPSAGPALKDPKAASYRLQVRDSPDSAWRDLGPADDSDTGLNCGRLLSSNQCPGFKGSGALNVRLLDAAGNTVWMLD